MVYSQAQAAGVQERLGSGIRVEYAMRYGAPAMRDLLARMRSEGVERVLVLPMYPQYSMPTVASVIDDVARYALKAVNQLEVRWVHSYPTHPGYIEALARRVEEKWEVEGRPDFDAGDRMVLSFHGIPVACDTAGDPYQGQCLQTAAALRTRLGVTQEQCLMTFQSKFGPAAWLTPATIDTVAALGKAGTGRVDVLCPGFATDCLETLEEIDLLNRDAYTAGFAQSPAAGSAEPKFVRVACLNDHPVWLDAIADIARTHTAGWDGPATSLA
jgi:ferrochelatase